MDVSVSEGAVLCLLCLAFISLIKATWGEETLPLAAWLLQKERDLASQLLMSSPRAPKASRTTWLTKPKQAYRQFYLSTHLQSSIISQGRKGQTSLLSILALWLPWKLSFLGGKWDIFLWTSRVSRQKGDVLFKALATCVWDVMQSWHILSKPVWVPWPWGPCSPSSAHSLHVFFGQSHACACCHINAWFCHREMHWEMVGSDVWWDMGPSLLFSCPFSFCSTYLGSELPKVEAPLPSGQCSTWRPLSPADKMTAVEKKHL